MPIFNLICLAGHKRRVVRAQGWKSTDQTILCSVPGRGGSICCQRMERDPNATAVAAAVKEVIDTGVMVKALERQADAERLHKDRVQVEDALAKGKDPGSVIR